MYRERGAKRGVQRGSRDGRWRGRGRVSTGIPGYGLRTEMIRKFFPFPLWKRFRKSGIPERFPERFFFRKPEISGTLFRNSGSLRNSGTFRKFPECFGKSFRKFSGKIVPEISGTIGTRITLKPFSLRLTYVSTTQHAVSKTNNIW